LPARTVIRALSINPFAIPFTSLYLKTNLLLQFRVFYPKNGKTSTETAAPSSRTEE